MTLRSRQANTRTDLARALMNLCGGRAFLTMVLKPLTAAELAVLAAGPPAQWPDDLVGWKKERNRYDGLVRRQKNLAKAAEPPQPSRRSDWRRRCSL